MVGLSKTMQAQRMFPYPVLLCDLGGTNCRFALAEEPDRDLRFLGTEQTDGYPSFADCVRTIIDREGVRAASLIVCAAGPIEGRMVHMTNAAWNIDGPSAVAQLDMQQGLLLNDFEALALSMPVIRPQWIVPISDATADSARPAIILGPGTGLGAAALVQSNGQFIGLETEAGHVDFAATSDEEQLIWARLRDVHQRITPETLLCGDGLVRLHAARQAAISGSRYEEPEFSDGAAADVTGIALADDTSPQAQTVRLFWHLIARYAGDLTLTYFAQGGVTLAGGILPRIAPLLDKQAFRKSFENKDPMRAVTAGTPVRLLTEGQAVLHGMAAIAARPDSYGLNYKKRQWR